jgi:hypothetical protein
MNARQKAQEIVDDVLRWWEQDDPDCTIDSLRGILTQEFEQALLEAAKVEIPTLEEVELHLDGCMEYGLGAQDCHRFIKSRLKNVEE